MKTSVFRIVILLHFIVVMLYPFSVLAHTDNSEGYSNFKIVDNKLIAEVYIDYFELGRLIDFGVNPGVDKDELQVALEGKNDEVTKYLSSHLEIYMDGIKTEGTITSTAIEEKTDRNYVKIILEFPKPAEVSSLEIQYSVFFEDNDPMHRNIATYDFEKEKGQFVFHGDERELQIGKETLIGQMIRFIKLGFHHIMNGYDHLLFVMALVLGTRRFSDILKVITVFTLAHSITLGLTAIKLVNLPSEIVEPLIALSIAFVAIEHFFGFSVKYRYSIVFGFGLLHGVGFAGALHLSDDVTWQSLYSILSFNIGIEAGQVLVIFLLFPLLLIIRRFSWSKIVHSATMTGIFGIGLTWYFQRFIS